MNRSSHVVHSKRSVHSASTILICAVIFSVQTLSQGFQLQLSARTLQRSPSLAPTSPIVTKLQPSRSALQLRAFQEDLAESTASTSATVSSASMLDRALIKVGKTTSAVVALTFFLFLAYYRDALMVSFFIGAISNGILGKILKKVIDQSRPEAAYEQANQTQQTGRIISLDAKPSDKGMPSSHGMSLGFICTFTALTVPWTQLPLLFYSMISLVYRVKSGLHTWQQIVVGALLGSTNGCIWHGLCFGNGPIMGGTTLMDWVSMNLLNEQGILPPYLLAVPAIVGLLVVGSFERRISQYLRIKKEA